MHSKNITRYKKLLYCCLCIFCAAIGIVGHWIGRSTVISSITKQAITKTKPQTVFQGKKQLTVLLLGCDEDRAPGGKKILVKNARSDTMIVAKLDFEYKRITGVSIPRDLRVALPGYKLTKINAYHKFGGKELAKQAAESVICHPIDRVVAINSQTLQDLVDEIGGVEVYVPKRMKWTDRAGDLYIDLQPGKQKLSGYNAMCFVRYRYTDSDTHRQERQKDFMLSFKDALIKKPNLLPKVVEKFRIAMKDDLSSEEMAAMALFSMKIGNDNISMGTIPTRIAGHFYLELDQDRLIQTLRKYRFLNDNISI